MFYGWEKVDKNDVANLLQGLKQLFISPDTWNYWPAAIDSLENEVSPLSADAMKWSLLGACELLCHQKYDEPMASFVSCATREYLNDISDEKLIHGGFNYEDEVALIDLGIEFIGKV